MASTMIVCAALLTTVLLAPLACAEPVEYSVGPGVPPTLWVLVGVEGTKCVEVDTTQTPPAVYTRDC